MIVTLKKITAALLIIAGMTPLLLPISVDIKEKIIYRRMEEALEKTATLQTIIIPEQHVIWMDKHEIWVNDQMFDISSKKLNNGVYTFTGLYDKDETLLVKQEKESSEKNNSENKELAKVFETLLHLFCKTNEEARPMVNCSSSYPAFINYDPAFPFIPIFTPPPRPHQSFIQEA